MSTTNNRRFPAEWEKQEGILLCFPHNGKDWPGKYEAIQWAFVEFIKKVSTFEKVFLIVADEKLKEKVIEMNLIKPINFHGLNSLSSKWKSDSSYSYGKLIEMCFERLFLNLSNLCSLSETCKSISKNAFNCDLKNIAPWCY